MRILQVVSDTDRRGAQVFALDLERALRGRGHLVETVALRPGRVGGLGVEPLGDRWPALDPLRRLRSAMHAADVTVAHGSTTGPACALAGLGRNRPFVYRQISDSRFWAPTRLKRLRVRLVLSRARRVVALSEFNRGELVDWIGLPARHIVVVPNGAPEARFPLTTPASRSAARGDLGLDPDASVVLCANALVAEKGTDAVIRAVGAASDAILLVCGDGPDRESLEALAHRVAPGRTHFLGSRADLAPLYHAADVVALASRGGDAMPAVLIEAGLCGLPAVSTRVGAIPEMIVDGETGRVTDAGDDDAFSDALGALLADRELCRRLGAAARTRCMGRYEIGPVADDWLAVLARAATGADSPA